MLSPAQALKRLAPGDIALGRLDVLPTLDGVEPGLWALDRLAALGVTVLNARSTLVAAHDKLATAGALAAASLPHPRTVHVAPWLELPELEPPLVLKPRFGSWGEDVIRCDDEAGARGATRAAPDARLVRRDRRARAEARRTARLRPADRRRRRPRDRRGAPGRGSRRVADERRARRAPRARAPAATRPRDRPRRRRGGRWRSRRHRSAAVRSRHVGRARGERRRRLQRHATRSTTTSTPRPGRRSARAR